MLAGLMLAFLSGVFLARRMVVPIQILRAGAQRIGGGDLNQRILVKTGDELEGLADQFNDMANRLQESYSASSARSSCAPASSPNRSRSSTRWARSARR